MTSNFTSQLAMAIEDVPEFFEGLTQAEKQDAQVVGLCVKQCLPTHVPKLFEKIPEALKQDEQVLDLCLEKCARIKMPDFFKKIPEAKKQDVQLINRFCDRGDPESIEKLFEVIPEAKKQDDQVIDRFLDKCHHSHIFELFQVMLDPKRQSKKLAMGAIRRVEVTDVQGLDKIRELLSPELTKEHPEILDAFKAKDVMSLGFCGKNSKLFMAALRLVLVYMCMVGTVELTLWYFSQSGEMAALRWKHWGGQKPQDYEKVSFSVMPGCPIAAAPQPFDVSVVLDSSKLLIVTAGLGFTARNLMKTQDEKQAGWKGYLFVAVMAYSLAMIPITFISLIWHFVVDIHPHLKGFWDNFACFYALIGLGPFQSNYLMYFTQFAVAVAISKSSEIHPYNNPAPDIWPVGPPKRVAQELAAPLLRQDISLGLAHVLKFVGKWYLFLLTMLPYFLLDIPFILAYKLPALVTFSPFILLLLIFFALMFVFTNFETAKEIFTHRKRGFEYCSTAIIAAIMEAEQAGYLPLIPAIWGLNIINQFLTLAPIYWLHNGEGWYNSAMTVLVERSIGIYSMVFFTKITSKYWSCISIINEST